MVPEKKKVYLMMMTIAQSITIIIRHQPIPGVHLTTISSATKVIRLLHKVIIMTIIMTIIITTITTVMIIIVTTITQVQATIPGAAIVPAAQIAGALRILPVFQIPAALQPAAAMTD